jgi:hypothetical protein
MTELLRRRLWLVAFLVLCSAGPFLSGLRLPDMGDTLLATVDQDSEANALREVDGFRAQGLWHDAGLGQAIFNNRYQGFGFENGDPNLARYLTPEGVYTHYPPGPEYLLYVAEALFGPEPVSRLRLLPLAVCWAATVFLGLSVRRRFGGTVGWLVMLACLAMSPFYDADIALHMIGYAMALLMVEIGLSLGSYRGSLPFIALGFLQGWMSFDWVFVVVLAPLALALALPLISPGEPPRLRQGVMRTCLVAVGFVAAHGMHFCEVWAYYGSLGRALSDMADAARFRSSIAEIPGISSYGGKLLFILYFHILSPFPISEFFWRPDAEFPLRLHVFRFLGLTIGAWWPLVAATLVATDTVRKRMGLATLHLLVRWLGITGLGLGVSCTWWIVMQNHAFQHLFLHYRHLFFWFFLSVLFIAATIAPAVERVLAGFAPTRRPERLSGREQTSGAAEM